VRKKINCFEKNSFLGKKRCTEIFLWITAWAQLQKILKSRKAEEFTSKSSVAQFISNHIIGWFEPMAIPNGANDPVRRRGVRSTSAELKQ